MDSFPRRGTGGRELVIAVFDVSRDRNCEEFLYSVKKNRGNSRESIEFSTVTSTPAGRPDGQTKIVGEWQSWTLTMKLSGPKDYELAWLRDGQWKQCGHTHPDSVGDVAFISCEAAERLSVIARRRGGSDSTFSSLLGKFMQRDSTLLRITEGDPFSDPGWGRCGSLGCCASEGTLAAAVDSVVK
ncbi:MAG: hypothetical protein V4813_12085 [Gemmatimonadota bacterium]